MALSFLYDTTLTSLHDYWENHGDGGLVAKPCLTLATDSMDSSLLGSSVRGILQARIWSGLPFSSLRYLPNPGIEPRSPALQADYLPTELLLLLLSHVSCVRLCVTP